MRSAAVLAVVFMALEMNANRLSISVEVQHFLHHFYEQVWPLHMRGGRSEI